jgi:L-ascorbate metabolism protein UlaG (beta-lactamase superfamily)
MKQTWHGHSAFRIEAGEAKILIDPFLSDNPSRDNGWSGYLTGKNSTQGGGPGQMKVVTFGKPYLPIFLEGVTS